MPPCPFKGESMVAGSAPCDSCERAVAFRKSASTLFITGGCVQYDPDENCLPLLRAATSSTYKTQGVRIELNPFARNIFCDRPRLSQQRVRGPQCTRQPMMFDSKAPPLLARPRAPGGRVDVPTSSSNSPARCARQPAPPWRTPSVALPISRRFPIAIPLLNVN